MQEPSESENILIGRSCASCGLYFSAAHGYPVECKFCYEESTPQGDEYRIYPIATHAEAGE